MAGTGPAPTDPSRRARRNKDPIPTTTIKFERGEQPDLPDDYDWPKPTRTWWDNWAKAPQSEHFMQTDWDFLLDTALVHAEVWSGNTERAGELRLRVAKVGATAEDRARLRIAFAEADEKEARPAGSGARERYGNLGLVSGEGGAAVVPFKKAAPAKKATAAKKAAPRRRTTSAE